jgi:hypothetical protein
MPAKRCWGSRRSPLGAVSKYHPAQRDEDELQIFEHRADVAVVPDPD